MNEEWRPVKGWPQYEVSGAGAIRRVGGQHVGQWLNDQGYALVRLSGPRRMLRVHRLVAEAFVPMVDGKETVNHINNNRSDNRATNLEWCSQQENLSHADRQGRMQRDYWTGRRSPNARLSERQVFEIRELYRAGNASWSDLAKRFGVSKRAIGRCLNGETYV